MRRLTFIIPVMLLGASGPTPVLLAQRTPTDPSPRPNVVLIMMDDLGYGDLGSYGAPDARTPNIDRLAREGVRLTDAYANGPVCTPTRAALISGRYQQRDGLEWVLTREPMDRDRGLPVTGTSLPALLEANGYATGLFGKWHLGYKPEFGPNAHGFGEFYGFLSGGHSYYTNLADVRSIGAGPPDLFENTAPVEATGYLTDEITRRAAGFIERRAGGPFFLEVACNAVHWPFEPPNRPPTDAERKVTRPLRQFADDSVTATRQDYVEILERADSGVGVLLATLDRLGLARNTLVIFTNDNGGEWLSRNAPLFHRKGTLWEGGIRVPLIMRWPGALPAGKTSAQATITMDLTASILSAARATLPDDYHPEGIDILPILREDTPAVERRLFWRITRPDRRQQAVRSGEWKLLVDGGHLFLFDVASDPGERNDLAGRYPERVVGLKKMLDDWGKDVEGRE